MGGGGIETVAVKEMLLAGKWVVTRQNEVKFDGWSMVTNVDDDESWQNF